MRLALLALAASAGAALGEQAPRSYTLYKLEEGNAFGARCVLAGAPASAQSSSMVKRARCLTCRGCCLLSHWMTRGLGAAGLLPSLPGAVASRVP